MLKEYKRELTKSSRRLILFTIITTMLITISDFVCPILIKNIINDYNISSLRYNQFILLLITYFLCYIVKIILNRMSNNYSVTFKTKESKKLINYMFKIKYVELNKLEPTYLIEKITYAINTLFSLYAQTIAEFVLSIATIIGCIIFMLFVNKTIAFLFIIVMPIQIIGYKKLNKKLADMCSVMQTICAKNFTSIISITSAVDFIKQLSVTDTITNKLGMYIKRVHWENAKVNKYAGCISITLSNIIGLLNNFIYMYTAILLIMERITLADYVFITLINGLFFPALNKIVNANISLRDLKGVYQFIEDELFENIEDDGIKKIDSIEKIEYDIAWGGYEKSCLISDVKMDVKKGDIVMIEGDSGCGKTTLMKGLVKFLDLDTILINNINIKDYTNKSLRNKVSFFSQNIPIVTGTIKENIFLGIQESEELLDKLKHKKFMKKFYEYPEGLETMILENGSNLSGGDKQKIAIARLFIEETQVVILDEITNSIDKEMAMEIIEDILEIYKNKIVFIISHDYEIEKYANKIYKIVNKQFIMIK